MSAGWFDEWQAQDGVERLARQADVVWPSGNGGKSKDWRCRVGWHDWHEVEMPDHDQVAECGRCGKRDWRRLLRRPTTDWHGGDLPPGA
jgi:hypothetical protein